MGVKYLSYLDLPPARRADAAATELGELRRHLAHPGLTESQRQKVQAKIAKIEAWVEGTLEATPPGVPHAMAQGENHEVVVSEDVTVEENVG